MHLKPCLYNDLRSRAGFAGFAGDEIEDVEGAEAWRHGDAANTAGARVTRTRLFRHSSRCTPRRALKFAITSRHGYQILRRLLADIGSPLENHSGLAKITAAVVSNVAPGGSVGRPRP